MAIQTYRGEEKLLTSDQFGSQLFDELEVLNPLVDDKGSHVPVTFISQPVQAELDPPVGIGVSNDRTENVFLISDSRQVDVRDWIAQQMLPFPAQVDRFSLTYDYTSTVELSTPSVQVNAGFRLDPNEFPILAQASPEILNRDVSRTIIRHKMEARPTVPRFLSKQFSDVNYWGILKNLRVDDQTGYQLELARLNALIMRLNQNPDWYQLDHGSILLLQLASGLASDITE